ncbi:IS1096 element passenger TnpR family protein [Nocardia sp. NBC_01327]|uniref:IS1096 element passenger TnpR family protein n=1 Tax=Nocardia sp. NBC_01327 TaxID=2903593 RepID=UPI002E0F32BD|nr:plasmid pRiA4b ORF-3 family protein [Nocardia sp. NBC_01327]
MQRDEALRNGIPDRDEALRKALESIEAAFGPRREPTKRPPPKEPRRPRRSSTHTYRVMVESVKPNGRIWRRLEVASDLYLDELQDLLETALGWEYQQRKHFGSAAVYKDYDTQHYLCSWEIERGWRGVPLDRVRLDELLVEAGDELFHRNGPRKEWQRVVRVEAVREFHADSPRAVCLEGPKGVDVEAVNLELSTFGQGAADEAPINPEGLPEALVRMLGGPPGRSLRRLRHLTGQAMVNQPVTIDPVGAADAMRPYLRLLAHIGADGTPLTDTRTLPPQVLSPLLAELQLNARWLHERGEPVPVDELRGTAAYFGLTEESGDRVRLTETGIRLLADPVALWWYIADHLPRSPRDEMTVLQVLALATDTGDPIRATMGIYNDLYQWPGPDPEEAPVISSMHDSWRVFQCLRMTPRNHHSYYRIQHSSTRKFARAVLQRWPRSTDSD